MTSLGRDFFDAMYGGSADPWGFESRWYEQRKHACTLAALPMPRFRRAFEPGCSGGVLSAALALRCDALVCWDTAAAAVAVARERLADRPHVTVEQGDVPARWPRGTFDLIVISELAYYLDGDGRDELWAAVTRSLEPGGTLVAVHWRHLVPEYPTTGDNVHAELATWPGVERLVSHVETDFRLEVHQRVPPAARSVAEREGLR